MTEPAMIAPGAAIGVLGGGQLGRMLALAGARMGLRLRVFDPDPAAPAARLAEHVRADWNDAAALDRFAEGLAAITLEWENVPLPALERLAARLPLRPAPAAIAIAQDRAAEKRFLNAAGVETAPWAEVEDAASLEAALTRICAPAILKTRRMGYDGKGQARLASAGDAAPALAAMRGAPAILEGAVDFARELSVVAARGADGAIRAYDPAENHHENGVLRRSTIPAAIDADTARRAQALAAQTLEALDYVGVLGLELFHLPDGRLLANEIAPRVHNTGHWTMGACAIDQFELHLRAICGWPLGETARHADAVMENLLGGEIDAWPELASQPGLGLHLYGKAETRPGRKMGHLVRLSPKT